MTKKEFMQHYMASRKIGRHHANEEGYYNQAKADAEWIWELLERDYGKNREDKKPLHTKREGLSGLANTVVEEGEPKVEAKDRSVQKSKRRTNRKPKDGETEKGI